MRRTLWGAAAAIAVIFVVTLPMLALRPHLSVATAALVLVVPVVIGVAVGGFGAGAIAAVVGFLVYDWFFIPPFGTFDVGTTENWVALGVYAVVVLVVARLVEVEQAARRRATFREEGIRRLFALSESLIKERPLDELLALVATTVHESFHTRWVAVVLPVEGSLDVVASAGDELTAEDKDAAIGQAGRPQAMTLAGGAVDVSRVALAVAQRPVGQLVIAGAELAQDERDLLGTFANEAALAIEQSQLRERATRTQLLEEVDRWRSALVGAVSHDLRTPLSTIKAAVTTLEDDSLSLSRGDHHELLATIEDQTDHLTRLVANLLDVARIESGTLALHRAPHPVLELMAAASAAAGSALHHHVLSMTAPEDAPLVDADDVLIVQVLVNLLSNAAQHAPEGSTITMIADLEGGDVAFSVLDSGPGVPLADRDRIFGMVERAAGSGRAGLGLAICKAFVEAHGSRITVGDAPGGGAAFRFSLPVFELEGSAR